MALQFNLVQSSPFCKGWGAETINAINSVRFSELSKEEERQSGYSHSQNPIYSSLLKGMGPRGEQIWILCQDQVLFLLFLLSIVSHFSWEEGLTLLGVIR